MLFSPRLILIQLGCGGGRVGATYSLFLTAASYTKNANAGGGWRRGGGVNVEYAGAHN